jgi:hypothetical protein
MSDSELKQSTSGKLVRGKPFEAGWEGGPGREKGGHNKTTRILKEAMLLAAAQLGDLSGFGQLGDIHRDPPRQIMHTIELCWNASDRLCILLFKKA